MRQVPNLRYTIREEYLGLRFAAAILDLLAMVLQCVLRDWSVFIVELSD